MSKHSERTIKHDGVRLDGVRSIAVLRANAVGDYIMSLPALQALRAAYPDAHIVLVGAPWHATFLPGRPGPVDEVVVLPAVSGMGGMQPDAPSAGLGEMLADLRARDFDLAVQLHGGGAQSNPLVRQFGARYAVGLRAPGAPELDRWVPYRYYQPEVARYLEVVALVGASPVGDAELVVTDADLDEARRVLRESQLRAPDLGTQVRGFESPMPLVAVHPGAADERRRWPVERFAALADVLAGDGAQVVITGSAGEIELVDRLVSLVTTPVTGLAGVLGLGGLAGLYSRCDLVISNDTGPRHLAQAVGAPTLGLFWCGNVINAAPTTRTRHRVLLSWTLRCPECGADCTRDLYHYRDGDGCAHRRPFLTDIPLAEAVEESRDLLSS
ncbi:MAG: glycosyltransferase family 9 protein [Actinomycetota bacterium]|nr:glycosyltransferase family 9 protein [Actinomycetota bacterium]